MTVFKGFFKRIASDFKQKELLPLKLLFFVHSSTTYVLYPYLTIHMRELGINVEETAIMSAVTPIVAIIMPPIAGLIADRIGNFKILLALFSGLGGAASLLLLLVPVGRIEITYPARTVMEMTCNQGSLGMSIIESYPCERHKNESLEIPIQIEACGMICYRPPEEFQPAGKGGPRTIEEEREAILLTKNYTVVMRAEGDPTLTKYLYKLGKDDIPEDKRLADKRKMDVRESRIKKNPGFFQTSVRNLDNSTYFFPTTGIFGFECSQQFCGIRRKDIPTLVGATMTSFREKPTEFGVRLIYAESGPLVDNFIINSISSRTLKQDYWNSTCASSEDLENNTTIQVPLSSPDQSVKSDPQTVELKNCSVRCLATAKRSQICRNMATVTEFDIRLTFWTYMAIRVFIGMIGGTAFAMFEGAVIAILREHKADYGLQRIYATIGGMISSPLSGWLIDYASENKGYTDFKPAFYLYATMKLVSALLMLTINLQFKVPATNVVSDVLTVLKKVEIVALFITCFILGTAWGYIESFLFWLLQDLGGSRSLMGITITVGGIAGLPLLVMSGPIIDKIGHANVLFIGFIFYAIRLLGYSLIYNPWMCLIFEAMESVTSSLAFTAAVTYAAKLSTTTTDSSIQGLLGGLYFGVGKGSGSLIGGYLMKAVGTRPTYQIFSAVTLATGCIYFLFNRFYIVRRQNSAEAKEKEANMNGKSIITDKDEKQNDMKKSSLIMSNETFPLKKSEFQGNNYNCVDNGRPKTKPDITANCRVNEAFEMESDEMETKKVPTEGTNGIADKR